MEKLLEMIPEEKTIIFDQLKEWLNDMMTKEPIVEEWNEFFLVPGFKSETVEFVKNKWEGVKKNDVFLVTFPKSGTNWGGEVILNILETQHSGTAEVSKNLPLPFMSLESGPACKFEIFDILPIPRRFMITHLPGDVFPFKKVKKQGAKVIYILRNPKDQAVSWYHFGSKSYEKTALKDRYFPCDWKDFSKLYFGGQQPLFTRKGEWYPEHILSWHKYKNEDNVKFVYFEDMKKELFKEVKDIAKFLEVDLSEQEAQNITDACSFNSMKKEKDESTDVGKMRTQTNLLRKGQVGNWKEYFTVAQSEAIDEEFQQKLSHTDIKFTYQL